MAELQYTGDGPNLSAEKRMRRAINASRAGEKITLDDAKALSSFVARRQDSSPESAVVSVLGGFEPTSHQVKRLAGDDLYAQAAAQAISDAYVQKAMGTLGFGAAPGNATGTPAANPGEWTPAGSAAQVEREDPTDDWSDFGPISAVKGVSRFAMTSFTSLFDVVSATGEAITGQLGGEDNNDIENPGDLAANWFNSIGMVQLLRNWNEQGDGWVGIGDTAGEERLAALTNLHNATINVNEGKRVLMKDPDTGRYKMTPLPPQMVKVHQDMYDSIAEAVTNDAMEQQGLDRELGMLLRIVGSVALDPLNYLGAGFIAKANKAEQVVGDSTALATAARNAQTAPQQASAAKRMVDAVDSQRAVAQRAEDAADELRGTATEVMDVSDAQINDYVSGVMQTLRDQEGDLLGQADTLVNALREKGLRRRADADDLMVDSQEIGLSVSNRLQEVEKELRAAGDLEGAEIHANTRRALDDARESFANRVNERAEANAARLEEEAAATRAATRRSAHKAGEAALDAKFAESRVNAAVKATDDAEDVLTLLAGGRRQTPFEEGPALFTGERVVNTGESVPVEFNAADPVKTQFVDAVDGEVKMQVNASLFPGGVEDPAVFIDKTGERMTLTSAVDREGKRHIFANSANRINEVGELVLREVDGGSIVDIVSVKGEFRDRGVARAMWDYAKRHTTPLHDPENQTRSGRAFSSKVDPDAQFVAASFTDADGAEWFRLADGTWSKNIEDATGVELRFDEPLPAGMEYNTDLRYMDRDDYSYRSPFDGAEAIPVDDVGEGTFLAPAEAPRIRVAKVHGDGTVKGGPSTDTGGTGVGPASRLVDQATGGTAWSSVDGARDSVSLENRVLEGKAWEPSPEAAAAIEEEGGTPISWVELDSPDAAEGFAEAINAFKASDEFGASVYAYTAEEYKGMRLFMSKDGKTGFAVKPDGDIVSVFNSNKGANAVDSIMPMAIQAGGRKADAFDTVLPGLYAKYGFKPVARMKWDERYKPEGWDKKTFEKFNNGEPDVVYLKFDEAQVGRPYTPGDGRTVSEMDDAVLAQETTRGAEFDSIGALTDAQKAEAAADHAEVMQAVARLRRAGSRGNRKQIDEAIANLRDTTKRIKAKWTARTRDNAKVATENLKGERRNLKAQEREAAKGQTAARREQGKADEMLDAADQGLAPGVETILNKADTVRNKINALEEGGPDALVEVRKLRRELKALQASISREALDKGKAADAEWKKLEELEEGLERHLELMATAYQMDDVANAVRNGDVGVLDDLIAADQGVSRIDGVDRKAVMDYFFGKRSAETVKKVLSLMKNPVHIHEMSGRQIPIELAYRIAKQTDPEKIVDEIIWALGSDSGITGQVRGPGMRLAAKAYKQGGAGEFGGKELAAVYAGSHARVPWGYKYDLADLEILFDGFSDWMRFVLAPRGGLGKLAEVDRKWMYDNQMRLLDAGDDLVARRKVIVEATLDLPRHLKDSGRLGDASPEMVQMFMDRGQALMAGWSKAEGKSQGYMNLDEIHEVMLNGYDPVQLSDGKVQRLSQMQSEVQFPSPKLARELAVRGTKLEKAGMSPGAIIAWFDMHVNQIWRQSVLAFRLAYTLRNAGEMMFRMWLNGDLHDPGTILAMAMDTRKHPRFNKLFATYGKDVKGDTFTDPQYGDLHPMNERLLGEMYRHHSALDTGDVENLAYNSNGVRRVYSDGKQFDVAMAHNLLNMWSDPIWREVMLTQSGRGSKRVMTWAEGKGITDPQDALVEYFRNGPGKRNIDRLIAERPEIFRDQYHLDDASALRTWLTDSTQEGTWAGQTRHYTLDYNSDIMDAFLGVNTASGGGARRSMEKVIKGLRENGSYVDRDVHAWALDKTSGAHRQNAWTRSVNWFFDASAAGEGMVAYSPFTRIRYWHHVEKMFPMLSKIDQKAILGVAREVMGKGGWTNKSGRQLRRLEKMVDNPSSGSGVLTRNEIHGVSARLAAKESEDMFYDAMRNKQHWSALRLAIPFGAAWANTAESWSKLATRSKGALRAYNLAKIYDVSSRPKWINDGSVDPVTMSTHPKLRAYIFPDPRTGEMSFTVPIVGSLFGVLTGNPDLATINMPLSSLNVATGGGNPLPGPGPILTIPFKTFRNFAVVDKFTPGFIDAWMNPFPSGEPQDLADVIFESMGAAWAKRIIAGVAPSLGDSQLASQAGPLGNYLFTSNPDKYGTRVELEDGTVTWDVTDAGARLLSDDVTSLSRVVSIYRGITANVSPGSLIWQWQATTQDGSHPMQSVMMQHWSELIDDSGGNFDQATEQWLDIYGPDAAIVLSSNWKADIQPSNRTWKWMLDNPEDAAKFSDVGGLFMPGGQWSFPFESWLRSGDARQAMSVEERAKTAVDMGYFVMKSRLDEKVAAGEITKTEAQERATAYREEYGIRYTKDFSPTETDDRIRRVEAALSSSLGATPAGQAVAEYKRVRDQVRAELQNREHSGITSEGNEDLLEKLRSTGDALAVRVPDFGLLWHNTYALELED